MARSREEVISEMVDSGLFSDDEIRQAVKQQAPEEPKKKGLMEMLSVPEQKSREGLNMIAQAVSPKQEVTGNMARDVAMNTPRIIMESLSDTAPGFISKESLLTAGALKGAKLAAPTIKATGSAVARAAESISGLEYKTPGILKEIANNPKLLFAKVKEAASPLYEEAKAAGGQVRKELASIPDKKAFVNNAFKMANKGELNATEALEARKELAALKKNVTGEFFRKATAKFNEIAKPVFGEADKVFEKGVRANDSRRFLPVNKSGGTSVMKSTLGTIAGVLPTIAMSPLAQSTTAAAAGTAAKALAPLANNAVKTAVLATLPKALSESKAREFLRQAGGNKDKARELAKQSGYKLK